MPCSMKQLRKYVFVLRLSEPRIHCVFFQAVFAWMLVLLTMQCSSVWTEFPAYVPLLETVADSEDWQGTWGASGRTHNKHPQLESKRGCRGHVALIPERWPHQHGTVGIIFETPLPTSDCIVFLMQSDERKGLTRTSFRDNARWRGEEVQRSQRVTAWLGGESVVTWIKSAKWWQHMPNADKLN